MSIFRALYAASGNDLDNLNNPRIWTTDGGHNPYARSSAGKNVTPTSAMALSAYFAAQRCIAEDIGKLPLITYERRPEGELGKDRRPGHPVFKLLRLQPNNEYTAMSFRETMTHHALGWGNGYAEIVHNERGEIAALFLIHPSRVDVKRIEDPADKTRKLVVYDVRVDDMGLSFQTVRFTADNILHIHGLGPDGLSGYSVLQFHAETLGIGLASQSYSATFFKNGVSATGVLQHPEALGDIAYDRLRKSMKERHTGDNAHSPMILEEGMTWATTGIAPQDAQLLQSRKFTVEDIARWFRIPPHKIQHLDNATFSNIESQAREYVDDTLTPWLTRWEQEIKIKLFDPDTEEPFFAEHLLTALLRGDTTARANFYRTLFTLGSIQPDEIRNLENMNPLDTDASRQTYMQTAMATIDDVASGDARAGKDEAGAQAAPVGLDTTSDRAEAMRGLVVEACGRVLRREVLALTQHRRKAAGNADSFRDSMSRFWENTQSTMLQALSPVCNHILGRNIDEELDTFVQNHIVLTQKTTQSHFAAGTALAPEMTAEDLADQVISFLMIINS